MTRGVGVWCVVGRAVCRVWGGWREFGGWGGAELWWRGDAGGSAWGEWARCGSCIGDAGTLFVWGWPWWMGAGVWRAGVRG